MMPNLQRSSQTRAPDRPRRTIGRRSSHGRYSSLSSCCRSRRAPPCSQLATFRPITVTQTGPASAGLPRRPPIRTPAYSSSPAAPAAGKASSRSIAGSYSKTPMQEPGRATTWSAGAARYVSTAGRRMGAGSAIVPIVVADIRGAVAEGMIPQNPIRRESMIATATPAIIAFGRGQTAAGSAGLIIRDVPALGTALPCNAMGRDFRPMPYIGWTDSGTGFEANLSGHIRRQDRMGRGHRGQFPRPRCRRRFAPPGAQNTRLRPPDARQRTSANLGLTSRPILASQRALA